MSLPQHNDKGENQCQTCGSTKNVERVPSMSQLIFGGFNVRLINRCAKCEQKVARAILRMIGDIDKIKGNNSVSSSPAQDT